MNARCLGTIPFAAERLQPEIEAVLELPMYPCDDAVGSWTYTPLWEGARFNEWALDPGVRERLAYIDRLLGETFESDLLMNVRVFAAKQGGYIRPHRDWIGSEPAFTRLHIPLQTDDRCLNSEDDVVYHMSRGEIWYLDGSRPHSGGCFSEATRLHLAVDFVPGPSLHELVRERGSAEPVAPSPTVDRPPLTDEELGAILGLAGIATDTNFARMLDMLGTVHFAKHVSCAAVYDWLIEIALRTGEECLVERARGFKDGYIGMLPPS